MSPPIQGTPLGRLAVYIYAVCYLYICMWTAGRAKAVDQRLVRIGLSSCRRFRVEAVRVFSIHIRCVEASFQDRAFQPLKGLEVGGAEPPPLQGGGADGSKLSGVAPTVVAPQEVDPDENPL